MKRISIQTDSFNALDKNNADKNINKVSMSYLISYFQVGWADANGNPNDIDGSFFEPKSIVHRACKRLGLNINDVSIDMNPILYINKQIVINYKGNISDDIFFQFASTLVRGIHHGENLIALGYVTDLRVNLK